MPKYYLLDENKNLVEGFDKEGFLALLEQAIEEGSLENIDENSAVASKIRSILNGTTHNIEFVTQAQYNQLVSDEELVPNTYYFITDDTTAEGLENALNNLGDRLTSDEERLTNAEQRLEELGFKSGTFIVSGISADKIITNSLIKQGKRVIANLLIESNNYGDLNNGVITIPSDFAPKSQIDFIRNVTYRQTTQFVFNNVYQEKTLEANQTTLIDFSVQYQMLEEYKKYKLLNVVWEL